MAITRAVSGGPVGGPVDGTAGVGRLLDYYLGVAASAMATLYPGEENRRPPVPSLPPPVPDLTDADAAHSWLETELPNLVAVAAHGTTHGWPTHAVRLSAVLFRYLDGDHYGQAHALTRLASIEGRLGRAGEAREHVGRALSLHRQAQHVFGEAWALNSLGEIEAREGRHQAATEHHRRALVLFRDLGHRASEAWTLDGLGASETRLRRHGRAASHHQQAWEQFRKLGDRFGQASSLNGLGEALIASGQPTEAIRCHEDALALTAVTGARDQEARAYAGLGYAYRAGVDADPAAAREQFERALTIYVDLDLEDEADRIRAALSDPR